MVNFQSDAMSMVHFSTAMRYQLFLKKLDIAIVTIIFLDHQEWLFFDYFAHFRTDYFGINNGTMKHWPGTMKNQPGTMKNYKNLLQLGQSRPTAGKA